MQQRLVVDTQALRDNARVLTEQMPVPVIAVVKMDGYGVTLRAAAEAWYAAGVRMFAVSTPDEALAFCALELPQTQVLLMAPVYDAPLLHQLAEMGVILTVTGPESAACAAACSEAPPRVHVKIDTGMGRFGIKPQEHDRLLAVYATEGIIPCGIYSHFAASFEKKNQLTARQLAHFSEVLAFLEQNGIDPGLRHIANSAAAIRFPETRFDAVRIGSALVGRLSCPTDLPLRRVGIMEADVTEVVTLHKGDTSGYASLYRAKREVTAAVVPLGFCHGFGLCRQDDSFRLIDVCRTLYHAVRAYRRPLSVVFDGRRLPVLGRIGNQYTLVETNGAEIRPGDTVTADINILLADSAIARRFINLKESAGDDNAEAESK